jgi:hypothetical protein
MAIGGVMGDSDPPRGLSENERVRSAFAREPKARFEQQFAERSTAAGRARDHGSGSGSD